MQETKYTLNIKAEAKTLLLELIVSAQRDLRKGVIDNGYSPDETNALILELSNMFRNIYKDRE